ncbi:stretch-activated Ca2+-permeable channel component-domain-containing protein [Chaetomium strumarium]|uniref:Stretch-activated Ca2+-permeable channel component-domain-containing protein n=1 Tax=Chaetomium strumarium TaxID=1170767 RepID=A0AAJ0M4D0_9PEZI|nr:stretch-activated Ca2+-permeable channel component-domain-containing protein [Chaetomium strumarium]
MALSPLQSRLAASLVASCLLLLLYLILSPPNFALAAELPEAWPVVLDGGDLRTAPAARGLPDPTYEPEFSPFDRSIIGRAPPGFTSLTNNEPMPMNVDEGATQRFVFVLPGVSGRQTVEDRLELRDEPPVSTDQSGGAGVGAAEHQEQEQDIVRRQASETVYISANTCQQPQPVDPSKTTMDPPQLTLYVSTSAENQAPGPLADPGSQAMIVFTEGAATYSLTTNREVYIAVHASNVSDVFSGIYNFRVVASTDRYYYSYNAQEGADLIWVSDSQGALLTTHDLPNNTDTEPYVLFAHNKNDRAINGLRYSYCGLQNYAQIATTRNADMVRTSMTRRGGGNRPKQQFLFSGLNSSAEYVGILATDGSRLGKRQTTGTATTVVFNATSFSTKSGHGNCRLIVDLSFCDQVAYSVPSNPTTFGNSTQLAQFYDNFAATMYANFDKSLAQIACEAPSSQRYSLARNCSDCATAYKDWLCSVTIPRCEDFSNNASYLQPRAISQPFPDGKPLDAATLAALNLPNTTAFNSSRNPRIDEVIRPGPYKELLPCDDLCYKLVQNCPAALGFACPLPGQIGFDGHYARHDPSSGLTCNSPGSANFRSESQRAVMSWGLLLVAGAVGLFLI